MLKNSSSLLSLDKIDKNITIKEEKNIILLCSNQKQISSLIKINDNKDVNIFVIYIDNKENTSSNIHFVLGNRSKLNLWVSNISDNELNDTYAIDLNGEKSEVKFYQSSFLNKKNKNKTLINVNHISRDTISIIKSYFVLKGESDGFVRCVSDLKKGCTNSNAAQELRLVVLDKNAKANSDPVLIINENDIAASHANAIGMLDPDQIFYMQSRGLEKPEAERLIVMGYFNPLINELKEVDDSISNKILNKLVGVI